jgi:CHAT domain-containing protein
MKKSGGGGGRRCGNADSCWVCSILPQSSEPPGRGPPRVANHDGPSPARAFIERRVRASFSKARRHARTACAATVLAGLAAGLEAGLPSAAGDGQTVPRCISRFVPAGPAAPIRLSPGEAHCYSLPVPAGHVLRVTAEQRGVDLALALRDEVGRPLLWLDRPNFTHGRESLTVVSDLDVVYRLEIHGIGLHRGTYGLQVEPLRFATFEERLEARAVQQLAHGEALRGGGGGAGALAVAALARRAGADDTRGWAEFALGRSLLDVGRGPEAIKIWRQLLPRWRGHDEEAYLLSLLGDAYRLEARYLEALAVLRTARTVATRRGDLLWQSAVFNNLGLVYQALGQYRQAIAALRRAETLAVRCRYPHSIAQAANNLSEVYNALGRCAAAEGAARRALSYRVQPLEDRVLRNLGSAQVACGKLAAGLVSLRRAVAISRQGIDPGIRTSCLVLLGSAAALMQRWPEATAAYDEALTILEQTGDRREQARILAARADLAYRLGDDTRAVELCAQSAEISDQIGDVSQRALALFGLARSEQRRERLHAARQALAIALDLMESLRNETDGGTSRMSFLAARSMAFRLDVDLLMELDRRQPGRGFDALAFHAAERQRARVLLDRLAVLPRKGGAFAGGARPLAVEQVQALLDDDTTLLVFFLGEERSFAWRVERSSLRSTTLASGGEIERAVRTLREQIRDRVPEERLRETGRSLSALLLAAPAPRTRRLVIVPDGALDVLPFAVLPDPLADGQSLGSSRDLSYLPSASVGAYLLQRADRRPPAPQLLALVADPVFEPDDGRIVVPSAAAPWPSTALRAPGPPDDRWLAGLRGGRYRRLPYSLEEAEAISRLVPSGRAMVRSGFAATRSLVLGATLGRFRLIHLATHGFLDLGAPGHSGIVLSMFDRQGRPRDGVILTSDLYSLRLACDLVVVSACESGLGTAVRGEGTVGMSHALFHAGTARTLVSLWPVHDQATASLMALFYQGLLEEGLSAPAALRRAQDAVRAQPRWRHPYYWAGFTLQGDWRSLRAPLLSPLHKPSVGVSSPQESRPLRTQRARGSALDEEG